MSIDLKNEDLHMYGPAPKNWDLDTLLFRKNHTTLQLVEFIFKAAPSGYFNTHDSLRGKDVHSLIIKAVAELFHRVSVRPELLDDKKVTCLTDALKDVDDLTDSVKLMEVVMRTGLTDVKYRDLIAAETRATKPNIFNRGETRSVVALTLG